MVALKTRARDSKLSSRERFGRSRAVRLNGWHHLEPSSFQKVVFSPLSHAHMWSSGISLRLKLRRLEYASTDDSEVCPKEWSDEGIFDETRARQLGGGGRDLMRRQSDGSWERRW